MKIINNNVCLGRYAKGAPTSSQSLFFILSYVYGEMFTIFMTDKCFIRKPLLQIT